ncbi:MAG TPA: NADH-quinone oxidoreductase subunit N [Terriglobia bacterium]|nr:NADH-quinone oxidoreductase subunit N [Terriglobia bacterium]
MWSAFFQAGDYQAIKPEILLTIFGLGILMLEFLVEKRDRYLNAIAALIGLGFATYQISWFWKRLAGQPAYVGFDGRFTLDTFALYLKLIIVLATALVVLLSAKYLEIEDANLGEYYALLLFSAVGMMFLASGTDLIVLFLGLEVMALCEYVLTGFLRGNRRSNEAAVKFFLLGAFSSGLLLYGMSLLYGIGGSTELSVIAERLAERPASDPLSWIAMITLLAGLFFKVAAVPFHQWTPDAYEGAPTSITAFISVAPKVASFAILLRILFVGMRPLAAEWQALTVGVAIATMTLGNLAAITQTNIKRFFGYSTISHVGYLLLGVVAAASLPSQNLGDTSQGQRDGLTAIVIYLLVYAFMNLGAFSVLIMMRRKDLIGDEIDDLSGLMSRSPGYAILMLIFLLSLAGIPPTAGFIGKYFIFLSLIETGHTYLAVLAVAYAVVALYYYFRIVVVMFMKKAPDTVPLATSAALRIALAVTMAFTLIIGVYPQPFIVLATEAIRPFFS